MDLSKILSINGMGGLFKVIAQGKAGLIVESLVDQKRMPAHASSKINVLDNISIYVNSGDSIPLKDLFQKMFDKQAGASAIDSKSTDDELKSFFESVLPEYDKEKVHMSDIRKAILWYNLLQKTDVFTKKEEEKKEDAPIIAETTTKKVDQSFSPKEKQGKNLNAKKATKKTIGVRKTGVA